MSFKTSCYFQDKPQTPCLGTRAPVVWLLPPSAACAADGPPASDGHSSFFQPLMSAMLCLPRTLALDGLCPSLLLGYPSSQVTLLPKLDFLGEAFAELTNQTPLLPMVSHRPASCPTLPAGVTLDATWFRQWRPISGASQLRVALFPAVFPGTGAVPVTARVLGEVW